MAGARNLQLVVYCKEKEMSERMMQSKDNNSKAQPRAHSRGRKDSSVLDVNNCKHLHLVYLIFSYAEAGCCSSLSMPLVYLSCLPVIRTFVRILQKKMFTHL